MRYERVTIKRDTHTVHSRMAPPWELPILEFLFEKGNVTPLGEFETNELPYPDPAAEFDRLVKAYGVDVKSGVPHVAAVYGDSIRGLRELSRAIEEAQATEDAAEPRTPRRSKRKTADALLT